MLQPGCQFVLQENGGNPHSNAAESSAIQLQRHTHVINIGRVVDEAELLAEVGVLNQLEVGSVENLLADQVRIGVEDRFAIGVDNGRVVNDGPAVHDRFQEIVQIAVGSEVVGEDRKSTRLNSSH